MKKRVAIWVYGGIGTGHFSQGYPMLEKLLVGLTSSFNLVIYSQSPVNENYHSSYFTIRTAPSKIRSGILRWLYLFYYFFKDNSTNKFQLLFAFWGYPAGFLVACLAKITRIPCAIYILGSDSTGIASINFGIFHKPIPRRLALWAYNRASLLLAISEFQKQQLLKYGFRRSLTIIPWGADPSVYQFGAKKRGSILHIVHVGHLTHVKDQTTLLKAVAVISKKHSVELRIFGVDCMNGEIQRLSKELGVEKSIQFLDMIPYDQMPEQYAWADIMLHTSLSEGQSMALTEAAACGVLLAGTKVGLLYDLGEDCGLLVDTGDFEGLASKVDGIINDQPSWDQKIQNAKQWSEAHDLIWTINQLRLSINLLFFPNFKK
jgi:glycosyltransferase involved in cell wall biosynthesis